MTRAIQQESALILSAMILGLVNHLYFNRFEPESADGPLLALTVQPLLLRRLRIYPQLINRHLSTFPLHPLAHVPGPRLYKVSKLWSVWICSTGAQHTVTKALHDKYGPFLRTGPNEVSIIHADGVKAVLGTGGFQKGRYYDPQEESKLACNHTLQTLRGEEHASRRKIWNRGLSSEAIQEYEYILAKRVSQLADRLQELSGQPVNLAQWVGYFTFDVMGDMAFGGGFELVRDAGDKEGFWTLIEDGMKTLSLLSHVPWSAPTLKRLPKGAEPFLKLKGFGEACARNRLERGSSVKDLWYHLMDEAGIEREKPSLSQVASDGVLTVVAGSDTTSTAISCFMWFVLSNPEIYHRVQAEVDSVYGEGDSTLDSSKHEELRFLIACLNETMRLQPPVPTNGRRRVPSGGATFIGGCFIPDETEIYVPPYSLHRNPANFSSGPDIYDPDRWFRQHSPEEVFNTAAFIPFSYGAANCVGKQFAWREMLMVTSTLLKRFTFRFPEDFKSEGWVDGLHDYFVISIGYPLLVEISSR
ncbi:cytochrome P450 [Favolaschia claudopus]|uniref:Cytochrome P450 n=1 Tax=Favolaschia claudopus TaxID=2862362 RepID=A0AAW0B2J8_9AGAR